MLLARLLAVAVTEAASSEGIVGAVVFFLGLPRGFLAVVGLEEELSAVDVAAAARFRGASDRGASNHLALALVLDCCKHKVTVGILQIDHVGRSNRSESSRGRNRCSRCRRGRGRAYSR